MMDAAEITLTAQMSELANFKVPQSFSIVPTLALSKRDPMRCLTFLIQNSNPCEGPEKLLEYSKSAFRLILVLAIL
jgi:hypothetical protein